MKLIPRVVHDFAEVQSILSDRDWQMAGPVERMLGPLLGEGVIMATGSAHGFTKRLAECKLLRAYLQRTQPKVKSHTNKAGSCDNNRTRAK